MISNKTALTGILVTLLSPLVVAPATAADAGFKVSLAEGSTSPSIDPTAPAGEVASRIVVSCVGAAKCGEVRVFAEDKEVLGKAVGNGRQFDLDGLESKEHAFRIAYAGQDLTTFKLTVAAAAPAPKTEERPPLADLLVLAEGCTTRKAAGWDQIPYDRAGNVARFLVSPRGNVRRRPEGRAQTIDEDDSVHVHLHVPPGLHGRLVVERTSPTRVLGELQIHGMVEQAGVVPKAECPLEEFELHDFAPGTAEVTISAIDDDGQPKVVGKFSFVVARLYDGMFTLGAFSSKLVNKTYQLAPKDDAKIIVPGEQGDNEIRYAVFYTPFIWAKRDFEKGPARWFHRINPSIGITTKELAEHALLGATADLGGGFVLSGGVHFARQTVLSNASGLEEGDPFKGEAAEIPTAKEWKHEWFVALSVDLRAVVALFKGAAAANP